MYPERNLSLKLLKQYAIEKLPKKSILRNILLSEPDQIRVSEFIIKMDLWTRLLSLEEEN